MPPKKKAATGYKFAEALPKGTVLEDKGKKNWRLGSSIGKGGFGEIYSAQGENSKGELYPYVIKIEPHANGPLFVETNFYIRYAKADDIANFKKSKGLKILGMPVYHGSGTYEHKGQKYRFLVMDKFSTDLLKLYLENRKVFPLDTVFKVGIQILYILEYIHQWGYVHADIKAANILLGTEKGTKTSQVYLVDFGLVTRFTTEKEFKPNPKQAHNGTIEFLSRDAHQGVQTRRGDLEILAYNLIQWLGCKLPWEDNLTDPKTVQASKEENMATVPKMIKASFGTKTPPKAIVDFLKYLKTLKFNTEPDYKKVKDIFASGVKEGGGSIGTPLEFSEAKSPLKRTYTPHPNKKNKKTKLTKADGNSDASNDEGEAPTTKTRGTTKKIVANKDSDIDRNDEDSSDEETPKPKKRANIRKNVVKNERDVEKNTEVSSDEETPKSKKRGKNRKDVAQKEKDVKNNGVIDSDEETPKPKKRGIVGKNGAQKESDVDAPTYSDGELPSNFVTVRNRGRNDKIKKRTSKSLQDLSNAIDFDGYNDAMKEVVLKKGARKNRVDTQKTETDPDDDMVGFTAEMRAIALKKKSREKTGKIKTSSAAAVATTSNASNKRGLVKPDSKRLQKKSPVTHGEVLTFSDCSISD